MIIVLCLLVEGFFSGSEIAVVSVNRAHLQHLVEKGSRSAKILSRVLSRPEWFLTTTLVGTNLATITASAVATFYVVETFGEGYEYLTILFLAPVILVFGEVLPKAIYQRYADRLAYGLIVPLRFIFWFVAPIAFVFSRIGALVANLVPRGKLPLLTRDELAMMFRAKVRRSAAKELEQRMIARIFRFSDRQAEEIMIPLVQVVSIRDDATLLQATAVMRRSGFSRIPVYSERVFNIVGWVNQHDLLLAKDKTRHVSEILRKVRYVPATTFVDRLLMTMQRAGDSLAVVVDEYGGAIGLITMEDVLEEVVGEIDDEYDTDMIRPRRVDADHLIVSARIEIARLNENLPQPIPEGDYETVGGFLQMKLQRMPHAGDEVRVGRLLFRVLTATERSVEEVEILSDQWQG